MCKHKHKTIIQYVGDDGWFMAMQCDMCGMLTRDCIPNGVDPAQLPGIDMTAYLAEVERRVNKLIASMKESNK